MERAGKPTYVGKVVIPAYSGITKLAEFFPGRIVLVDDLFQEILDEIPTEYETKELCCHIYRTDIGYNIDNSILRLAISRGVNLEVNRSYDHSILCSFLRYLGHEGGFCLTIPKGQKKESIILGYAEVRGKVSVILIEHRNEYGMDVIRLSVNALNRWEKDQPLLLVIF